MSGLKRWALLVSAIVAMLAGYKAVAQVPTTTVQDTVYYANGTPAQGIVLLSWDAFITANGAAIAAGSTSVTLGVGGSLTVALTPNLGSTPMGNYYTAVYHLNDGETNREFWVVPVDVPGGGPAKLAGIRNQVLPTSVAMQSVTKQYVDDEILAAQIAPIPLDSSPYVLKTGDTMTGTLVLTGVHVSSGTLDGVIIGGTTPAAGSFTAVSAMSYVNTNVISSIAAQTPAGLGASAICADVCTATDGILKVNTGTGATTGIQFIVIMALAYPHSMRCVWQSAAGGPGLDGYGLQTYNGGTNNFAFGFTTLPPPSGTYYLIYVCN